MSSVFSTRRKQRSRARPLRSGIVLDFRPPRTPRGSHHRRLAVKTLGIDDQSIAFPLTCRITHPSWSEVLSQLAAIQEDLPPEIESLVDDHDKSWSLDDLPRGWHPIDTWDSLRKAIRIRILSLVQSSGTFVGECLAPRLI